MLSFELSAIDLILTISVVVLLILYFTKMSAKNHEEIPFKQSTLSAALPESPPPARAAPMSNNNIVCPRGRGNIRKLGEDNYVSERCLGCYRLMECYSKSE